MQKPQSVPARPILLLVASLLGLQIATAGCGSDRLETIRQQQAAGNFAATLEPLRELLAERPGDAEIQYLYGSTLDALGQWSLAEWSLREAMNDPEWLVPAGLQLAHGALRTMNLDLAIETTDRLLEVRPDDVAVRLMRANALAHSQQHHEEALQEVDRILELDPENVDVMEPKILALIGLKRIDEAGEAIDELGRRIEEADLGPDLAGWHCATAALFAWEGGETELAEERWADCVERFPSHPNVVGNATQFYDSRLEFDRSLEIVRRAHELEPASRDFRVVLAQRLRDRGDNEEAGTLLREAAESEHPQLAATAWYDLMKHYQAVEQYGASAEAGQKALEAARQAGQPLAQILFDYADALVMAGQHDQALEVIEESTVPAHQWMIRARVAQERGEFEEALADYDKAFELWPNNPWARYYAALAAEALGDFDRAVDEYRYSIRIQIDATDARLRVARLHLAEGKPLQGLTLLRTGSAPLGIEGELLALELEAQLGNRAQVMGTLRGIQRQRPQLLGPALARVARGYRDRAGPEAAVVVLGRLEKQGVDLGQPALADALRELVRYSDEAGRLEETEATVRKAVEAYPEAAPLQEILGLYLELRRDPGARDAYARALELDPGNARALTGMGRLALASDPEQALAHFEAAAAAAPSDPEPLRGAAEALAASGRGEEAEARLEALLAEHPYDGAAAAALVEQQLARGVATEATVERARRAVRFGGGAEALELLSRVYQQRDEPELAQRAAERAQALRSHPVSPLEGADGEEGKKSS